MPGLFGGIGCTNSHIYSRLRAEFAKVWANCENLEGEGWLLGGHAFAEGSPLFSAGKHCYAVDGQHSLYIRPAKNSDRAGHDFEIAQGVLHLGPNYAGNLALIDTENRVLHLAVEWSGTFPLYFTRYDGGLLFSSHLRPLARVTQKAIDELGMLEFLRNGFTFCGRTVFSGIERLLPGQHIGYHVARGAIEVQETSQAWGPGKEVEPVDAVAEHLWRLLDEAIQRSVPATQRAALMMSAGWDSRTLLAALSSHSRDRLICYSHGDIASRELNIVSRLARYCGADCRLEPIDSRVLDVNDLQLGFERVENVVFPHWHRAGRLLAEMGASCVTAGVYGEVMGGHYGPPMLLGGRERMIAVAKSLLPGSWPDRELAARSAESLLSIKPFGHHWYLSREFEQAIPFASDKMNADVETDLIRLRRRGMSSQDHLIEAFIAEHRGSQYINAQLLSCRAHIDIAIPLIEQELLGFVSRLPFHVKVHNLLNQRILREHAHGLLRFPFAATLVPASAPLFLQETSRFIRKAYESRRMALYERTKGRTGLPRLGWVNFEFLRSGVLSNLVEDLRSEYWDRVALQRRLQNLTTGRVASQLHPIYDQLGKIYTVDLLCR